MASSSLQHFLHNLHQGAAHQWNNFSTAILPQFGSPSADTTSSSSSSFVDVLGSDAHISNFLQSLGRIQTKKQGEGDQAFRMHVRLPFAGIVLSRDQKRRAPSNKVVDAAAEVNGKSLTHVEATQTSSSEKGGKESHGNVPLENSLLNTSTLEQQSLHMQLHNKELPWTGPVSKEELGRATWILLHTLAAQFPNKPTRQQQRDAKELMAILSRIYPCKECADHFKEVLKTNPVQAGSGLELAQWMCMVHNIVNRSLGKPIYPCQRVDARWGAMDCDESACDLQGRTY